MLEYSESYESQMAERLEIVRVQVARDQYRVTIPKRLALKAKLRKGTPLFISIEGERIILEPVKRG